MTSLLSCLSPYQEEEVKSLEDEEVKAVTKTLDDSALYSAATKAQAKKHPKESKFATLPAKMSKGDGGAEKKSHRNKFNLSLKSSQSSVERPIYEGTPPTTPEHEKAPNLVRPITPPSVYSTDDSLNLADRCVVTEKP